MAQHKLMQITLVTALFAVLPHDVAAASVEEREAAVKENPLKEAYFGETHLHTSYSLDAVIGGARLSLDDAYRFAKGETVTLNGREHNIVKPLDFAAVTDHAEFIGEMLSAQVEGTKGYDNEQLVELRGLTSFEEQEAWFVKYVQGPARAGAMGHPPFWAGEETTRNAWQMMVETAQKHYEPGVFTTLVGFEWTSAPNGGNMHRNVLFRDLVLFDLIVFNRRWGAGPVMLAPTASHAELGTEKWAIGPALGFVAQRPGPLPAMCPTVLLPHLNCPQNGATTSSG